MANYKERLIQGAWKRGYALDLHTLGSTFLGYDEYGHARFDSTRSEVGELLYRLKYSQDAAAADEIAATAQHLLGRWGVPIDVIVPVPPTSHRALQPVPVLAKKIAERMGVDYRECVSRVKNFPQLKSVSDLDERAKLLEGAHKVDATVTTGKCILLFDDLFRSGATMNAITSALHEEGKSGAVYALTVTRTRSNA